MTIAHAPTARRAVDPAARVDGAVVAGAEALVEAARPPNHSNLR